MPSLTVMNSAVNKFTAEFMTVKLIQLKTFGLLLNSLILLHFQNCRFASFAPIMYGIVFSKAPEMFLSGKLPWK